MENHPGTNNPDCNVISFYQYISVEVLRVKSGLPGLYQDTKIFS